MRYWGALNQSEMGAPATGAFGEGLRRNLDGRVVNDPAPVAAPTHKFRGLYGAFVAKVARNSMAYAPSGYHGIFPMDQQPELQRADPWTIPQRGGA